MLQTFRWVKDFTQIFEINVMEFRIKGVSHRSIAK